MIKLITCLTEQNLDALDVFQDIYTQVNATETWLTLKNQIDNLDFKQAIVTANKILKGNK